MMDVRFPEIAGQLLLIERELRLQGLWAERAPDDQALASTEPFCVDTLPFEGWLQWIFLPGMKLILESNRPLPPASGILAMAEVVYADRQVPLAGLFQALQRFDLLISEG